VFGIFDVAKHVGLNHHDTDFGITLGRMHVGAGPYIYVPVLGPSSTRDIVGTGVDFALDPLNWIPFRESNIATNSTIVLEGLDTRAEIDSDLAGVKRNAVDPYATIRSIFTQVREAEVRGGAADVMDLPAFPDDPPLDPATPAKQ
jgi:phospholipid-binding lipoprotein MlaA